LENLKEIDIIITLIAGTFVMFIMAGVIVFSVIKYQKRVLMQKETLRLAEKKYQNDLLDANIIAAENERKNLAKNIHDEVGALIQVIKQNNFRIRKNIHNETQAQELLNANNELLLSITQNISAILNDLMSPSLQSLGFIRALNELCTQINISGLLNISIDDKGEAEDSKIRFSSKVEIQLYKNLQRTY